jgi:hypothetical protein
LKLEFKGVRSESRDFFFLIHRHKKNNKIPTRANPPTTPPITAPTFVFKFEFEAMLTAAAAAAEDCAGLSPACVGELYPIVATIAWLELSLWNIGAVVTLAWLCATAVGVFEKFSEEVEGKAVAEDSDEIGAATAGSIAEVLVERVAVLFLGLDIDEVEGVDCGLADKASDVLVD